MEGSMTLKTILRTTSSQRSVFRWFITKYMSLEPERLYCQAFTANGFNYSYKLLKARGTLYIAFQCEYSDANGSFFFVNRDLMTIEVKAKEISGGLYVGDFPESDILSSVSARDELMMISFRFMTDCSTSVQNNLAGKIGPQTDFDELCYHIQSGYINSKSSDFTIKLDKGSIKAHKSVLYIRSGFFEEFFTKDEKATEFTMPDITPGIMHQVLLYVYGGELSDIKTESMVKVLEVAYLLKILSLKDRCLDYFEETNTWEAIEGVQFFEYEIKDH